jgi:mRNA guanylyltransferase
MGGVSVPIAKKFVSHCERKVFCHCIPRLTYSPLSRLKKSGEQIDDRVVEVHWDPAISRWRMMRFRDDKPHGNHRSVVENIIQSIADGVEKDAVRSIYAYRFCILWLILTLELLERSLAIRSAWKARQPVQPNVSQAPQQQQQQSSMRPPPVPVANPHTLLSGPSVEFRYGPLAPSPWSKVSGPSVYAGMKR